MFVQAMGGGNLVGIDMANSAVLHTINQTSAQTTNPEWTATEDCWVHGWMNFYTTNASEVFQIFIDGNALLTGPKSINANLPIVFPAKKGQTVSASAGSARVYLVFRKVKY